MAAPIFNEETGAKEIVSALANNVEGKTCEFQELHLLQKCLLISHR
jgi:hypothetical protein